MNVGDIYWARFPGGAGHAQSGRRPAIVLQNASATARISTVLVVPLTTQLASLRFPGTVLIETEERNNLRRNSVALLFQLRAMDKIFFDDKIGTVSSAIRQALLDALDTLTQPPSELPH